MLHSLGRHLTRGIMVLALVAMAPMAHAVGLLRDAGMERALQELARPILNAAGLSPSQVRILVVNSDTLNAFVVDQRAIFLHAGLIMRLKTPEQLQAVIAHEAAHIANGHIARRAANVRNASRSAAIGLILGAAAGVAGGNPALAGGAAVGSAGSAQRVLLGHTRAEEASADQSSIRLLLAAGIDPKGALEVLDIFRGQEALSVSRQDPYSRSHPLTSDRYRAVQALVNANPRTPANRDAAVYWFARAQGILTGFKRAPSWTLNRAKGKGDVDTMRRAIAYHRQPNKTKAIREVNALVSARPNDPYYRDLQGQILLESREFSAAIQAYRNAVNLAPNDALILGAYGRALLAPNTPRNNAEALRVLIKARGFDGRDSRILRDLGLAHARAGNNGLAALAGAERAALVGRRDNAVTLARRASGLLPRGSAGWQRAQDILQTAERLR
ncbi:M48 family metalloprotease [Shimia ponticola]|uniref:M48 family metalloprotease n=1 Tax=Shimia ponticola TaxID=2582893 RepID=UPI002104C124|nr:M48 family metalloprotease [Shimia ponticola]